MTDNNNSQNFNFTRPAIYKITVQGIIDKDWSERHWGLQVNTEGGSRQITTLIGQINDQAALSGLLNNLYELHITVISVKMLSEVE